MKLKSNPITIVAVCSLVALNYSTFAQGTAFTYQGQLNSGGAPANGSYDIAFSLYGTSSGGLVIAVPVTNSAVSVSNGLFTTTVDFGNAFTGASNWLEIAVSTNGLNTFGTLTPRQQLTPVPYAVYAGAASNAVNAATATTAGSATTATTATTAGNFTGSLAGDVTGTQSATAVSKVGGVTSANVASGANAANAAASAATASTIVKRDASGSFSAGTVTGGFSGNGGGLTNLTASQLISGTVPDARLSSNVALRVGGNTFTGNQTISGGNVGIGTTSPSAALDARISTTAGAGSLISEFGSQALSRFQFFDENVSSNLGPIMFFNAGNVAQIASGGDIALMPGGNVGIGTVTPSTRLSVVGSGLSDDGRLSVETTGGTFGPQLRLNNAAAGGDEWVFVVNGTINGPVGDLEIVQSSAGASRLAIDTSGNVGIGTETPAATLEVNGNALVDGEIKAAGSLGALSFLNRDNQSEIWQWNASSSGVSLQNFGGSAAIPLHVAENGNVGIGTGTPGVTLEINGTSRIDDHDLFLRSGSDQNHGLGYRSSVDGIGIDGPFLYGFSGGALGSTEPDTIALSWDYTGDVSISNNLSVSGVVSMGSGIGTAEAPNRGGLVIRRINSTTTTSNSVVAVAPSAFSGGNFALVRDGTDGGFVIHYPTLVANEVLTVACMGIDNTGAQKNFYTSISSGSGTLQIYNNSQNIVHFECTFGDTFQEADLTKVTLTRGSGDNYWIGDVNSTYNQ